MKKEHSGLPTRRRRIIRPCFLQWQLATGNYQLWRNPAALKKELPSRPLQASTDIKPPADDPRGAAAELDRLDLLTAGPRQNQFSANAIFAVIARLSRGKKASRPRPVFEQVEMFLPVV